MTVSKPEMTGSLLHLYSDLHDPGTLALLCPFIENRETSLDGIPDIDLGFLHGLTLGVTARNGRATDNKTAIFGIFFDDDFQIHTVIIRGLRLNIFALPGPLRSVYVGAW